MSWRQTAGGVGAALAALVCLGHPAPAGAINADESRAGPQLLLASNARAKPMPAAASYTTAPGARAKSPVRTAAATGAEQVGYVHYFLLRLPDETVETQVGIELPGGKIAWSVPGLGVVVSPVIEEGTLVVGGAEYEYWHLYGIRPFPDDASMSALRRDIGGRVQRWVDARTPYCEDDGPFSDCMSCLGFVLRVLFPGRHSDYPDLPADFKRVGRATGYSTRELLLYLTGMYDLSTRDARLKRVSQSALPEALRDELLDLVHAMGPDEQPTASAGGAAPQDAQKRRIGTRPIQRKRL
jgi:hypothetical protein